ncbi:MAG: hypothetical protein R3F07_11310 [Opitutaceae bacterium]
MPSQPAPKVRSVLTWLVAVLMKVFSASILKRTGDRSALRWNTMLLGGLIAAYSLINPGSPVILILCLSFLQRFIT